MAPESAGVVKRRLKIPALLLALFVLFGFMRPSLVRAQTFTILHNFQNTNSGGILTNSDGTNPNSGLIVSGNVLYGTAIRGGCCFDAGTVFALNTDGSAFTPLYNFDYR